ncbi:sensor histidine kinase [Thermodesulfobacteriota bacterium]
MVSPARRDRRELEDSVPESSASEYRTEFDRRLIGEYIANAFRLRILMGGLTLALLQVLHVYNVFPWNYHALTILGGVVIGLGFPYRWALLKFRDRYILLNTLFVSMDILLFTIGIYYMGGVRFPTLTFVYMILLCYSSMTLPKWSSLSLAFFALLAYSLLFLHEVRTLGATDGFTLLFTWLTVAVSLVTVTFISVWISGKIREGKGFAELGRFSARVAHEIRNPLGIIYNEIKYLKRDRDLDVGDIEAQITRIDRFIREILDYTGDMKIRRRRLDLNELVDGALTLALRSMPQSRRIKVDKHYFDGELFVMGDHQKLEQCFINILTNSIQAVGSEGGLIIDTTAPNTRWAEVRIADDGEGISRANLRRIFDPFFTTRGGKNGVGVGLATVKRMIDLHDGRIEVASRRGRGTRFSVSLPTNLGPGAQKADESR